MGLIAYHIGVMDRIVEAIVLGDCRKNDRAQLFGLG